MLIVKNDDFKYWMKVMGVELILEKESKDMKCIIIKLCFGYVDLNGVIKYGYCDIRNVLEWLFVREMIVCVVVGVVVK